jgi:hypothetical protein
LTRRACAPEVPCDLAAAADMPALVVALTAGRVLRAPGGEPQALALGAAQWLAAGEKRVVQVKETSPAELLLFEFKGQEAVGKRMGQPPN